jgi:hypothetical protein
VLSALLEIAACAALPPIGFGRRLRLLNPRPGPLLRAVTPDPSLRSRRPARRGRLLPPRWRLVAPSTWFGRKAFVLTGASAGAGAGKPRSRTPPRPGRPRSAPRAVPAQEPLLRSSARSTARPFVLQDRAQARALAARKAWVREIRESDARRRKGHQPDWRCSYPPHMTRINVHGDTSSWPRSLLAALRTRSRAGSAGCLPDHAATCHAPGAGDEGQLPGTPA